MAGWFLLALILGWVCGYFLSLVPLLLITLVFVIGVIVWNVRAREIEKLIAEVVTVYGGIGIIVMWLTALIVRWGNIAPNLETFHKHLLR